MAWIELHQSLPTHRKTLELADALDIPPVQAVGHISCLWLWALDNAPDGDLSAVKPRTLARAAMWDGDPEAFLEGLATAGFVADGRIHDWSDYTGRLIEKRRADVERKRQWRDSHRPTTKEETPRGRHADATRNGARTQPDSTQPYPTQPPPHPTPPPNSARANGHGLNGHDDGAPHPADLSVSLVPVPKDRQVPSDPVAAALAEVFGQPFSTAEKRKHQEAADEARRGAAEHGIPLAQMAALLREGHANWPNVMADAIETPRALVNNLSLLVNGPQRNGRHAGKVTKLQQTVTQAALVTAGRQTAGEVLRQRKELGSAS